MSATLPPFTVAPQEAGFTLAKVLRSRLGGPSWGEVRKLIAARRVKVGDAICSDDARRLRRTKSSFYSNTPSPCRESRTRTGSSCGTSMSRWWWSRSPQG